MNFIFYPQPLDNLGSFLNVTNPPYADTQLKIYRVLTPLLGILIITLNFAIVVSSGLILYRGHQPRSTYIFLGNLALSDFLTGIAIVFNYYYPSESRDDLTCSIQIGLIVSSALASGYSVGLIAIDRYLYIIYGLQYQRYIYPNRARLMIIISWIVCIIIGFLPSMGFRNDTGDGKKCWFVVLAPKEVILSTTFFAIIPIIINVILYSIILKHALQKITQLNNAYKFDEGTNVGRLRFFRGGKAATNSKISIVMEESKIKSHENSEKCCNVFGCFWKRNKSENNNEANMEPIYTPSKWKAIKVVLFTTGSFFVTWPPFLVASTIYALCDAKTNPFFCDKLRVTIITPLTILGFTNSLLNPIIYAWWHNGFRESLKKMYKNILHKTSDHNYFNGKKNHSISKCTTRFGGSDRNSQSPEMRNSTTTVNTDRSSESSYIENKIHSDCEELTRF